MSEPTLLKIFLSVLPMLLLVGAWYFFMRQMRGPKSYQAQCLEATKRQTEALERIAAALEKRQ